MTNGLVETMQRAGLLPARVKVDLPSPPADGEPWGVDLLPWLHDIWETERPSLSTQTNRRQAERVCGWLRVAANHHSRLLLVEPRYSSWPVAALLGNRLLYCSRGIPSRKRLGVVSSRLGRSLDEQHEWFRLLRAVCARCDPVDGILVVARGTTPCRFVERCAELFGRETLLIETSRGGTDPVMWLRQLLSFLPPADNVSSPSYRVLVSPPIVGSLDADVSREWEGVPDRDRALVVVSDQLVALRVRRNGNLDRLFRYRIASRVWSPSASQLAIGVELTEPSLRDELLRQGAVGWTPINDMGERAPALKKRGDVSGTRGSPAIAKWGEDLQTLTERLGGYLTHCTRRRDGPWPDQTESQYLDDLILSKPDAEHSPLAAIRRIIETRRLVATSTTIRGGTRVVSFTSVPLGELHRLRVFRPHRGRWDFEPYGICVSENWLRSHGARRVRYATDDVCQSMTPSARPFFQLESSAAQRGAQIDWTVEQEWRHVGDLDLRQLPPDQAIVFVPSEGEAEQLAELSPWPVSVLQPDRPSV